MGEKTCLGLACSPRKNGNTGLLLKTALKELEQYGIKTETIALSDVQGSPCLACEGCHSTGRCVLKDGVEQVYAKILQTDFLVMAAPVYSMGICAQAKILIDRAQQFWATRYLLGQPVVKDQGLRERRRGIFISTAGTGIEGVFQGTLQVVEYFFKIMEVKLEGTYCYSKIDQRGEILHHAGALEEVKKAATKMVITNESRKQR